MSGGPAPVVAWEAGILERRRNVTMVRKAKFNRVTGPAVLLLAAGLLSGCDTVSEALGLSRSTPDEFRVVSRAPLEVPPDFNLRPPQPGSPRPQELERDNRVTASVFGAAGGLIDPRTSAGQSQGEAALLSAAGADAADPDIRAIVDRENPGVVIGERSFLERLMFWRDGQQAENTLHQGAPPTIARTGTSQAPGGVAEAQPAEQIVKPPADANVILSIPVRPPGQ